MIEVSDLQVIFGRGTALEKQALNGLSLSLPPGQFVTVIGSNGAGKSTLLNVISGDIIPDGGQVTIDGQTVTAWSAAQRAALVARVFQNPLAGSCAELTVAENLVLAHRRGQRRSLRPALNQALQDQFRERLARLGLGLEKRLGDAMGLLSGGQRQAVSLVMATLAPTKILLLDEHTAALDPKTAEYILDVTRVIVAEQNLTTLMVTHSMRQALELGDRTIMLHGGKMILDVADRDRQGLSVSDLLAQFEAHQQDSLASDTLLLS